MVGDRVGLKVLREISTCLKHVSQYQGILTFRDGYNKVLNRWRLEPKSAVPGHVLYREKSSISKDERIPVRIADQELRRVR